MVSKIGSQVGQALSIGLLLIACDSSGDPMGMGPLATGGTSAGSLALPGVGGASVIAGSVAPPVAGGIGSGNGGTGASAAGRSAIAGGPASGGVAGMAGVTAPAAGSGAAGMAGPAGGAAAGAGAMPPAAGSGGTTGAPMSGGPKPPCLENGSELVFIGDSYINWVNNLAPRLQSLAQKDGALPTGSYRDYAVGGTSLATGGLGLISPQWDRATRDDPNIKFVVMSGGGNDVLLGAGHCLGAGADQDASCRDVVERATEVAKELQAKMKAGGVKQILYFFYPHVPVGGDDILDYAFPKAKEACEMISGDEIQCYTVDTRPTFEGHPEFFDIDGIHPSAIGADAMAQQIWNTMKTNCMAQSAENPCCMP